MTRSMTLFMAAVLQWLDRAVLAVATGIQMMAVFAGVAGFLWSLWWSFGLYLEAPVVLGNILRILTLVCIWAPLVAIWKILVEPLFEDRNFLKIGIYGVSIPWLSWGATSFGIRNTDTIYGVFGSIAFGLVALLGLTATAFWLSVSPPSQWEILREEEYRNKIRGLAVKAKGAGWSREDIKAAILEGRESSLEDDFYLPPPEMNLAHEKDS